MYLKIHIQWATATNEMHNR